MERKKQFLGVKAICVSLLLANQLNCQNVYVNKEWEAISGTPGQFEYISSIIDNAGNLVTVGNHKQTGNSSIFFNCVQPNGNVAWSQTCPVIATTDDFGTDIITDANNNIYVCGAQHNGANYDYLVSKYTAQGVLIWQQTYNGTGNGDDIPSAITLDNAGNVYVTGASSGTNSLSDFATIKYSNNGTQLWSKLYDFSNKYEAATDIIINNAGEIIICGASASNPFNADFVVIKYNATNGNQIGLKRHNTPGNGIDFPVEMIADAQNNIYVTGIADANGNKDIKTIALNSTLQQILWTKYTDLSGNDDEATGITKDNNGHIIVTGHTQKSNLGKDLIIEKRDAQTGNLIWERKRSTLIDNEIAKGKKIKTDANDNIFVTGEIQEGGITKILTSSYRADGTLRFEKIFAKENSINNKPSQIQVSGEEIYVTGIVEYNTGKEIVTIKYNTSEKDRIPKTDINGKPIYVKNELIIHFEPNLVDTNFINNKDVEFTELSKCVNINTINKMDSITGLSWKSALTYKIFHRLTTDITYSITRLGDTINVPKVWSVLLVKIPKETNEIIISDSLNRLAPDIYFSEVNATGQLHALPNDELLVSLGEQKGLVQYALYPNAHINMTQAWDFEVGQEYTKVGVYDSPIYWSHEDFGDGTFSGSKIKGGWDFNSNAVISNIANPQVSHGTATAGIIGALRNNNIGIAGIAGGDVQNGNTGVQLFSMGIFDDNNNFASWDKVAPAILEGALNNPTYGYGLNVQNHSWGGPGITNSFDGNHAGVAKLVLRECNRNQCVFVASRGNDGLEGNPINYPACIQDQWCINVGASGIDGSYKNINNGDSWWESSYGNGMDLIAPGTTELISSTTNSNALQNITPNCVSARLPNYECFNGTSASAPHVAGVASLMQSYHHVNNGFSNNLSPDDIEYLLEKYSTDVGVAGYDQYNGHGRLNAGLTMSMLQKNKYQILHNSNSVELVNPISQGNVTALIPNDYYYSTVPSGIYSAIKFKVTVTIPHNIGNKDIIDAWVRNSNSDLLGDTPFIYPLPNIKLESYNSTSATLSGFIYFILQNTANGTIVNKWLPSAPGEEINWAYSLHLEDKSANIEDNKNNNTFSLYPNPTKSEVILSFNSENETDAKISIIDITGRLIYSISSSSLNSNNQIVINTQNYNNGIYNCVLQVGNKKSTKKLIINR
jgi:hypothetical protein